MPMFKTPVPISVGVEAAWPVAGLATGDILRVPCLRTVPA
eukprot:CAMPEP_0194508864 /NCGR_PEP_ID=MMETSP0253-20130528/39158_1 /TAXON_ID=2966 /ORGANISM="Noctiluca scintillans" /LENGTH=39 /DNA_ID= /DNA_START= /DNA_END= /DNA_ORIENTATION=